MRDSAWIAVSSLALVNCNQSAAEDTPPAASPPVEVRELTTVSTPACAIAADYLTNLRTQLSGPFTLLNTPPATREYPRSETDIERMLNEMIVEEGGPTKSEYEVVLREMLVLKDRRIAEDCPAIRTLAGYTHNPDHETDQYGDLVEAGSGPEVGQAVAITVPFVSEKHRYAALDVVVFCGENCVEGSTVYYTLDENGEPSFFRKDDW